MLVLNNLPNVQILNGRSTKDEDDEEEDNGDGGGEFADNNENDEINNHVIHNVNINNIYNNEITNRNNHLYPQMEEIEEDKNLENNSNYVSETNNNEITENNIKNFNSYGVINEKEKANENYKDKKITRNINNLNEKVFNPKIDSNGDGLYQPNELLYDKIVSNKEEIDLNINTNQILNDNEKHNQKLEKESIFDLDNSNNEKNGFLIDLTNEELDLLKEEKYNENSKFISLMKEYYDLINNEEENSDGKRYQDNYINKIKTIEEKKSEMPNYYYFFLLFKKKMKIIQNMYKEIVPYIINRCPELNKDNIFLRLNNELFNTIKDCKELINLLHLHIDGYAEKKSDQNNTNQNNMNELIKEKDKKISDLENIRNKLLLNIEEEKGTYEKKIENLEKENKIMTEKILSKANSMVNSTIIDTQTTIPVSERFIPRLNNSNNNSSGLKPLMNNQKQKYMFNNEILNTNFVNHYYPTSKTRSPNKLTENTNTLENTINYYLNTNSNVNNNKQQLISLKTLKDFINELYNSKSQYDIKCTQYKIPKETLEEHMYTFLNKKYGLKNLIIEWAKNVIRGIKYYSKKDSIVLLFGKIMRNEQEEDARFIIEKVSKSIEELLLYYIKRQNPLKLVVDINKIFDRKKKSELLEEEWKGIIYSIYEKEEANEIEKKIDNFICKENEKKKMELFKKYKNSRINSKERKNKYNNNNYTGNNSYYLNTFNSLNNVTSNNNTNNNSLYINTIGNISTNNKLSRVEKYNTLLFTEEKNILFKDFIKIVLDDHIRFRDKQLKKFVELFKIVDKNRDGIINEEEFTELVQKMKIFKEDEVENRIFQYLEKIDPFDNQKFTFSECVTFFSGEMIIDKDINGNEKEISVLEKVCFNNENKNGNDNLEINEIEPIIESGVLNNNNNNAGNNNNDVNINDK